MTNAADLSSCLMKGEQTVSQLSTLRSSAAQLQRCLAAKQTEQLACLSTSQHVLPKPFAAVSGITP